MARVVVWRDAGGDSYSWGRLLNDVNYMGYDPAKDYLKTGVMTTEAFTLSTGSEKNQSYFSASALNSGGIIPNNRYNLITSPSVILPVCWETSYFWMLAQVISYRMTAT